MKSFIRKIRRNLKPLGLIFLGAIILFTSVFAIINFCDSKNTYADSKESITNPNAEWLFNEKPENFEPQLTLNKYAGAENSFDEQTNELIIDFPIAYSSERLTINASDWEEDNQGNYTLSTNSEGAIENLSIEHISDNVGTILLEINEQNSSQYSSFRMDADGSLLNYVENNASKTDIARSSVEDTIIFTDAEIVTYSADGSSSSILYNNAQESWRDFSDEQIQKLIEFTSDRRKRVELETVAKNLNDHSCFSSRDNFPHITDYFPEFIFTYPGKSVFIGQEYGFVLTAKDLRCTEMYNENVAGKIEYCRYDEDTKSFIPYIYSEKDFHMDIHMLVFSIDRRLEDREYKCNIEILFSNLTGSYCHQPSKRQPIGYNIIYGLFQWDSDFYFLADPSVSMSVKNLYDLNDYDTNYSKTNNDSVGISQVRVNFCGYDGEKLAKEKVNAKDIVSSIWSIGGDMKNFADGVTKILKVKSFLKKLADLGGSVGAFAGTVLALDPYIAVVKAAYDIFKTINDWVDSRTTVFKEVSANNEANILTFPAPSEQLTTTAVASMGMNYSNGASSWDVENAFKDIVCANSSVSPKFVMGKFEHYVQTIFMLSEVNKPTALISYFNPAFAIDNSGRFNSKVEKFLIPEKFNYSEKITRAFDNGYAQDIKENNKEEVSFFGSDSRKINLSVSETGVYDFELKDLLCVFNNKEKVFNSIGQSDNGLIQVDYEGYDKEGYIELQKNGNPCGLYVDKNKDGIKDAIRLNLDAGQNNNFVLKIRTDLPGSSSHYTDYTNIECLGATFTADLQKYYEGITPSDEAQKCNFNDDGYVTYNLLNQGTGLYKIEVENAEFDLYSYDFKLLNQGQRATNVFMIEHENYYVRIKKSSGVPTITFSQVSESKDFNSGNSLNLDISLSASENTKIQKLNIARSGIYTFDYAKGKYAGYTLQVKDECFVERLFGAKKAYLDAGEYYLLFKSSGTTVEDTISISFTPQAISLEKEVELPCDNYFTSPSDIYYSFVPPQGGFYTFILKGDSYAVSVDDKSPNAQNRFELTAGQNHIVHIIKTKRATSKHTLTVEYSPSITATYHQTINEKVVMFTTDITGYYSFNGVNMALYNKYLTLISDGNGGNFVYPLDANEKYFIIKTDATDSVVILEGEKITANFEATFQAGNHYLMFKAPEDGYYNMRARYSGISELKVYAYDGLSGQNTIQSTEDGYYLNEGGVYYIKLGLLTTDKITVINGNIKALPEILEGNLSEVNLSSETNYASSYKFVPSETGKYTFIFSSDLSSEFKIYVNEECFDLSRGSNVLKVTKALEQGKTYEIKFNLTSEDNATLIFGVHRQIEDFVVYVGDRELDDSELVNKIAIGADRKKYVEEYIIIRDKNDRFAITNVNFEIFNSPIVEGECGVKVDASGHIMVSNKLPQWTAFSVEVNVGRVKYGDIILDNGITNVINFLIYVDVQDIQIFDEDDNVVFSIDVAPKQTINLTAKVFPYHAAQANTLSYSIGEEGSKYISLETDGFNAIISGKFTTPNNTYVKIEVKCADEFTAVIMVRVHAEIINIYNQNDFKIIQNDETKTAYELVLKDDVACAEIKIPSHITYLKIRRGTKNRLIDSVISVNSNNLTLVLESVEITGQYCGAINANQYKLDIYFVGTVTVRGKSGDYVDSSGYSAICAKELDIYSAPDSSVDIIGGDGLSITGYINDDDFTGHGGDGGDAIDVSRCVNLYSVNNLRITGGDGGRGMDGKDAETVYNPSPSQADPAKNGTPGTTALSSGERGGHGGNGGSGIKCESLVITNSNNTFIYGGRGGNAGDGGNGADGGNGGKGGNSNGRDAGIGGKGGKGSNGGQGGDGGNGAAAVDINREVTIVNSQPKFKAGDGGNGGHGGDGGNGGRGGDGGDDTALIGCEAVGGDGGDGGDAGSGGSAGKKGENMKVSLINVNLAASDGENGKMGYKGYGGEGGDRGDVGGYNAEVEVKAKPGKDGEGEERP